MGPARWPVRQLHTLDDVGAWLGLDDGQLKWFADRRGLLLRSADERLQHYTRRWVARGERLPRLLESPKLRLKAVQRKLLEEVLEKVPAHEAAHGFVKGRSAMTHAAIHAGQRLVVRFDLTAFFTWLQPMRAYRLFRSLGYTHEVSSVLLGLCTTRTPQRVLRAAPRPSAARLDALFDLRRRLAGWHLPQGAPTSPALANLTCWSLDTRLQAWAERAGLVYSRYADDLVFSGASTTSIASLSAAVSAICCDEGFLVNDDPGDAGARAARSHWVGGQPGRRGVASATRRAEGPTLQPRARAFARPGGFGASASGPTGRAGELGYSSPGDAWSALAAPACAHRLGGSGTRERGTRTSLAQPGACPGRC